MTYEQALKAPKGISSLLTGSKYLPYRLPISDSIQAPTDKKRLEQFMELYNHYRGDWHRTVAHFQLEDFEEVVVFTKDDQYHAVIFNEFRRLNRIHIAMYSEVDDNELL